jgi:nitrite reductase/ring-hydroxylating ferredoxin subunit
VGGEDHKTGQPPGPESALHSLEAWARHCFPMVREVVHRWSGQVIEPVDYLAYIGHNPWDDQNLYIVTGDSGHGMTHSTIASMLIPDLIAGRSNPWQALYDPRRKSVRTGSELARENLNVAAQYRDYLSTGELSSVQELAPDSGAVIRHGLKKLAVYRDPGGALHTFSAVCPHLQCIVRWNPLEKSWDCPCHGSRFAADGHAVNGPATDGLSPAE